MPDTPETPEHEEPLADVPESVLEAARAAPGHWLGMVDPAWRGEGAPPDWAVVGQYRSSARGEVVEWRYNDGYRPSPAAHGWPPPTDPVDEAIQLAVSGYGSEDDVLGLLADAEVGVMIDPDGRPVEAYSPDGTPVVPVFTSEPQLHSGGRYATRTVRVPDLVGELGEDVLLYVNPAGAVCITVDPEDLVPPEPEPQLEEQREPEREPEPERGPESDVEPDKGAQGSSTRQHLIDVLSGREL
ncbi:type VII secretion system-associated protein [Streptomyces violaceorubidus]